MNTPPPLSLYIHIPWCIKKCPYCDFNSHAIGKHDILDVENAYVDALIDDLTTVAPLVWGRMVHTIFIGGGTPNLFSARAIDKLLSNVRSILNVSPFVEITMEANPGANHDILGYAQSGVNRISFGVQSFNDQYLKALGRVHNATDAINAIVNAQKYFSNINIDIIYGIQNQSIQDAITDVMHAVSFGVEHISCYNLTVEPNTDFFVNTPTGLPDNDLCHIMGNEIVQVLASNGYNRYEVSAYAKNNMRCKHNLNYWRFGDYIGIGCGAHQKLSGNGKIVRQMRHKSPKTYMQNVPLDTHIATSGIVSNKDLPFEFMLNALRLVDGVELSLFHETTGVNTSTILPTINQLSSRGLLDINNGRIKTTQRGFEMLNDVLSEFI